MYPLTEQQEKNWMIARIIAIALGFAAPALYLVIALLIHPNHEGLEAQSGGHVNLMFYLLLSLAILDPLLVPVIERIQIGNWRRSGGSRSADQMYLSIIILRLAFVEACFVYGMMVYFLSHDFARLLLFYPVGLIWLAVYWPRRDRFELFVQTTEVR